MAMSKSEVVVDVKGSDLALPAEFLKELALEAKDAAAQERPAVSKFSTRAGVLQIGGNPVPGNNLDAVILFGSYRNVWYDGAFDADNIKNPSCFSLAENDEGMVPDPSVQDPPNGTCKGCPKNEWKSDVRDGKTRKGKACKESRRLVLMPAAAVLEGGEKGILAAELAILDLPVTSAKNYGAFVNAVAATAGVPPYACIANVKLQPHPKNQFEVIITPIKVVPTVEAVRALKRRVDDARKLALEPYDETSPTNSAVIQAEKAKEAKAKF